MADPAALSDAATEAMARAVAQLRAEYRARLLDADELSKRIAETTERMQRAEDAALAARAAADRLQTLAGLTDDQVRQAYPLVDDGCRG